MKRYLSYILILLLSVETCHGKGMSLQAQIDSPLEAAIFYFPSPSVMRCLNHSEIPKRIRKAVIYRKINFPNEPQIEQNITISISPKKSSGFRFSFKGNVVTKGEITPITIKGGPFFSLQEGGQIKPSFLFGLEDLIGVQRKIHIQDTFGNQNLNYEVFLRTTKGMIGNENYKLDLFGTEKTVNGKVTYTLNGKGNLGDYSISVAGIETGKDNYEIIENYGPAQVFTSVRVYD